MRTKRESRIKTGRIARHCHECGDHIPPRVEYFHFHNGPSGWAYCMACARSGRKEWNYSRLYEERYGVREWETRNEASTGSTRG